MKKSASMGYAHATCMDCDWELIRINAQGVGAKHAKHHKHKVFVDVEINCVYDGREESTVKSDKKRINDESP